MNETNIHELYSMPDSESAEHNLEASEEHSPEDAPSPLENLEDRSAETITAFIEENNNLIKQYADNHEQEELDERSQQELDEVNKQAKIAQQVLFEAARTELGLNLPNKALSQAIENKTKNKIPHEALTDKMLQEQILGPLRELSQGKTIEDAEHAASKLDAEIFATAIHSTRLQHDLLPRINKQLESSTNSNNKALAIKLTETCKKYPELLDDITSNIRQSKNTLKALITNAPETLTPQLAESLERSVDNNDLIELINYQPVLIEFLLNKASPAFQERVVASIEKTFAAKGFSSFIHFPYRPEIQSDLVIDTLDRLVKNYIQEQGLNAEEIFDAWSYKYETFKRNIERMRTIEAERPGGLQILRKNFGIKAFGRYPVEILITQIDEVDKEIPYGVVIYPRSDHNDAFYDDRKALQQLYTQTRGHEAVRIFEAEGALSLSKILLKADNNYGDSHKISYVFLAGHGTAQSLQLGYGGTPEGTITPKHLQGKVTERIKETLAPEATVILFSCSTGEEQGIAQNMSAVLGREVIAPDKPASPGSLQVSYEENIPRFNMRYGLGAMTKRYRNGAAE